MKRIFKNNKKLPWQIGVGSATVGLIASTIQAAQTISYYKEPTQELMCEINTVFSCSGVFEAWQSSVFGFANSLMCMIFFALMLGVMLAGLTKSKLNKTLRLGLHFATVFFLLFGAWYLWSSAYVIASLCVYCVFCYAGVIGLNWVWLRINVNDLPFSSSVQKSLKSFVAKGYDTSLWLTWAAAIVIMFLIKFV